MTKIVNKNSVSLIGFIYSKVEEEEKKDGVWVCVWSNLLSWEGSALRLLGLSLEPFAMESRVFSVRATRITVFYTVWLKPPVWSHQNVSVPLLIKSQTGRESKHCMRVCQRINILVWIEKPGLRNCRYREKFFTPNYLNYIWTTQCISSKTW